MVRTLVRWRDGELSVTRRGDVVSEQTFVAGARKPASMSPARVGFGWKRRRAALGYSSATVRKPDLSSSEDRMLPIAAVAA